MKNWIPVLLLVLPLSFAWAPRDAQAAESFLEDPKAAVFAAFDRLSKDYPKGKAVHLTRVEITAKRVTFKVQNARNEEEVVTLSYSVDGDLSTLPGTDETLPDLILAQSFSLKEIDWEALMPFMQEAIRQSKIPSGTIVSLTAWKDWPKSEEIVIHATIGGKAGESGFARADAKGQLRMVDSTVLTQ